jgi:CBS domain containing-hemolysin-like protein
VNPLWAIAIVFGLIVVNAMFVAAEFAIVGVARVTIENLAQKGDRRARKVARILADPRLLDEFIATAQIGITVASLALGMYGEHALADWLARVFDRLGDWAWLPAHGVASVLAITFLSYLHIVVGEMVPKTIALAHVERVALTLGPVILFLRTAAYPVVIGLNGLGNLVLRMVGIRRRVAAAERACTPDELRYVLLESHAGGQLRSEAGKLMLKLFEFGNLTAGEAMVPRVRVTGVRVGTSATDLAMLLHQSAHTRYPVYEQDLDHIIGVMHVKDALRRVLKGKSVFGHLARPVPYVPISTTLDEVLKIMGSWRVQMVVVMDEHGGTAGILTIEDVFEEVVGEIDEHVQAHPEVWRDELARVHASGLARLSEVNELLPSPIYHDQVSTIGGLVLALLGRPPQVGDRVQSGRYRIEVRSISGRGVDECVVAMAEPAVPV